MSEMSHPHPVCSWIGLEEGGEHESPCGRPAQYTIEEESGHRWFACAEHLSEVHARAPRGHVTHNAQHIDDEGRPIVSPESSITWQ